MTATLKEIAIALGIDFREVPDNNEKNRMYVVWPEVISRVYDNEEYQLISLFHEYGHQITAAKNYGESVNYNTLMNELECWNAGIKFAYDLGIVFTDSALKFGYEQALSYVGHDEREYRNWKNDIKPHYWVEKSKKEK